jgi:glutamate dehydrogenase/leucine dehydrogenase
VQGFGNVGYNAARLLHEEGKAHIVALSDVRGGIYHPDGLVPRQVKEFAAKTGTVVGYPGARVITNDELLELECDLLVPAALENQITGENAAKIRASIIVEGANGPTTPEADAILREQGVFVVPDILANAGGVCVSYYEWVQDRYGYYWPEQTIKSRLRSSMTKAFADVSAMAEKLQVTPRLAAYCLGVQRITDVRRLRGLYG